MLADTCVARSPFKIEVGEISRREHPCHHVTRPVLSSQRNSINEHGQLVLQLRGPFRDGTAHLVFDPLPLEHGDASSDWLSWLRPPVCSS